jgi:hypothetical protein
MSVINAAKAAYRQQSIFTPTMLFVEKLFNWLFGIEVPTFLAQIFFDICMFGLIGPNASVYLRAFWELRGGTLVSAISILSMHVISIYYWPADTMLSLIH